MVGYKTIAEEVSIVTPKAFDKTSYNYIIFPVSIIEFESQRINIE